MNEIQGEVTSVESINADIAANTEYVINIENATPELVIEITETGPMGPSGKDGKDGKNGETPQALTNLEIEALINSFV